MVSKLRGLFGIIILMMIISFALTHGQIKAGQKTVTRRLWKDNHAAKFKVGQRVIAYDKSPRNKGKPIGYLEITDKYREQLKDMPEADLCAEGGLWESKKEFIDLFGGNTELKVWVIRFKLISSFV